MPDSSRPNKSALIPARQKDRPTQTLRPSEPETLRPADPHTSNLITTGAAASLRARQRSHDNAKDSVKSGNPKKHTISRRQVVVISYSRAWHANTRPASTAATNTRHQDVLSRPIHLVGLRAWATSVPKQDVGRREQKLHRGLGRKRFYSATFFRDAMR